MFFASRQRWPCDSGVSDYSFMFLRVRLTTEAAAHAGGKDKYSLLDGKKSTLIVEPCLVE